jgi:hypothetical protein
VKNLGLSRVSILLYPTRNLAWIRPEV